MPQEQHSQLAVLGTVGFYMFVAISMTMLNKNVLSSTPLPVFLLFCQSAVAIVLLYLANMFGPIKTPKFDMAAAKALVPLTIVNVLGLAFNNACLQYVDASFHQVARGMVLPSTIAISTFMLAQYPTRLSLAAASVVTIGFFSGVIFDPNHATSAATSSSKSQLGIIFGLASSVMSAFHAVLIKRGLNAVGGSPIALSYYNNILSTAFLAPMVVMAGEAKGTMALFSGADLSSFAWGAAITGFFGFLISVAAILSIKVTSPVTHMISSAVRGVLQTFIAVWIFGDIISFGRTISIFLITAGSALYVYAKSEEAKGNGSLPTAHARSAAAGATAGVGGTEEEKAAFIPMTPTGEKR